MTTYVWIVQPKRGVLVEEGGCGAHESRFGFMFKRPIHFVDSEYTHADRGYAWRSKIGIITISQSHYFNWRGRYRDGWLIPNFVRDAIAKKLSGKLSKRMLPYVEVSK